MLEGSQVVENFLGLSLADLDFADILLEPGVFKGLFPRNPSPKPGHDRKIVGLTCMIWSDIA